MEQIISGISAKLNERISKKQFITECGLLMLAIAIFPSLISKVFNIQRLRMEGDNIFLDNELFIRRENE